MKTLILALASVGALFGSQLTGFEFHPRSTAFGIEHLSYRHTAIQAVPDKAGAYSKDFGPFGQAMGLSIVGDSSIAPFIALLGFPIHPPHIAGDISLGVVLPIQGLSRLWVCHFGVKPVERSELFGEFDFPIKVEIFMVGIRAASHHCCPMAIGRGSGHAMGLESLLDQFNLETAARFRFLVSKFSSFDDGDLSAVALAIPVRSSHEILWVPADYSQHASLLADHINWEHV